MRLVRKALVLLVCSLWASLASAQFENVDDTIRLGGKDVYQKNYHYYTQFMRYINRFKVVAKDENGNIIRDAQGNEMYTRDFKVVPDEWPCDSMYECWRRLYDGAPFYTVNTYIYGATMLDSLARYAHKPEAERLIYFQDLMQIYEDRIRRNDSLNSTVTNEKAKSKRSAIKVKAADVYYHTAPLLRGTGYTPEKAYQYYADAFEAVRGEADAGTDEIEPSYIMNYFMSCRDLYGTDKEKYLEQFLTDYSTCLESCDKMMAAYQGTDEARWKNYAATRQNIQYEFIIKSGAGTVANLERFYSNRLDSIKDNYDALKSAINLMINSNDSLIMSNVFYRACRLSYKIKPDYINCIGMAQAAKNQLEDKDEALKYFKEAERLSVTDKEHFLSSMFVGQSLASEEAPSSKTMPGEYDRLSGAERNELRYLYWIRQKVAAEKLQEAIDYGKRAGVNGQTLAPVYYMMARAYRRAMKPETIEKASEALDQLLAVYPAYEMKLIDTERTNINSARKTSADNAAKEAENKKKKAKDEAQLKAYKRQQDIIRAEEDFWKH